MGDYKIVQLSLLKERDKQKSFRLSQKVNGLGGDAWLRYSISIWSDITKTTEEQQIDHPAMFPKELPKRLIEIFLTEDKTEVLDPFMGVGSTLVAAKELGKHGIGFEICDEYARIAKERISLQQGLFDNKSIEQSIYIDDARNMYKYLRECSIDLCITSPPYWDILTGRRTADRKTTIDYIKKDGNLGKIHNYEIFLKELETVFRQVYIVLKKGARCVINVMDIRKKR